MVERSMRQARVLVMLVLAPLAGWAGPRTEAASWADRFAGFKEGRAAQETAREALKRCPGLSIKDRLPASFATDGAAFRFVFPFRHGQGPTDDAMLPGSLAFTASLDGETIVVLWPKGPPTRIPLAEVRRRAR